MKKKFLSKKNIDFGIIKNYANGEREAVNKTSYNGR